MAGKTIAFYDFDGTLTASDSLQDFVKFTHGKQAHKRAVMRFMPLLVAMQSGIVSRQHAKERVMSYFYKGWSEQQYLEKSTAYSATIPSMLRPKAVEALRAHKEAGIQQVIVTAAMHAWLQPWCAAQGFDLIASRMEVVDGKLTGKLKGNNCQGQEKVARIGSSYDLSGFERILAYGDTKGDLPMLALAHEPHYQPFRD